MNLKLMLTINEASEYTGIGRNTIRNLVTWNLLPVTRVGKKILIQKNVLNTFIKLNEGRNLRNRFELVAP